MKILVDADACPVKKIVEETAALFHLQAVMFADTSHELHLVSARVVMVDKGTDSVDLALMNQASAGDIIVTQDFGLAALALGKGCFAIRPDGLIFTDENIGQLLTERCISAKIRRAGGRNGRMKKRGREEDAEFREKLTVLCRQAIDREI